MEAADSWIEFMWLNSRIKRLEVTSQHDLLCPRQANKKLKLSVQKTSKQTRALRWDDDSLVDDKLGTRISVVGKSDLKTTLSDTQVP